MVRELIMAETNGKITVRIFDAWIENNILYGIYEIIELNKLIFTEREINDDQTI